MLQNGNNSLKENWPSFCSSCKSDLQSFFSIGVPSYLDEYVSSTSSGIPDASWCQITNNQNKAMQSIHEIKIRSWDKCSASLSEESQLDETKNVLFSNSQLKSPRVLLKHVSESFSDIKEQMRAENVSNMTSTIYKMQQLNDITHKRLYDAINVKSRTAVVGDFHYTCQRLFENLKVLNTFKFCDSNMEGIRSFQRLKSAVNMQSLDRWKEIRDVILWERNVKVQSLIAPKVLVNAEVTQINLRKRRRNVYKLAIQVAKLRSVNEISLFMVNQEFIDL